MLKPVVLLNIFGGNHYTFFAGFFDEKKFEINAKLFFKITFDSVINISTVTSNHCNKSLPNKSIFLIFFY